MVLLLVAFFYQFCAYGMSFKVDTLSKKDITVKVADQGSEKIMMVHKNPEVLIIDVASIYITSLNKKFIIEYNSGPSADPTFNIKWQSSKKEKVFSIYGTDLDFRSSGEIYVSGHTNNKFSMKRKFVFKIDQLIEVQQPYYYAGIKTTVLLDIDARLNQDEKSSPAFHLSKGEAVQVILSSKAEEYFLLKNKEGLLGWIQIPIDQRPTILKDIFLKGD